MSLKSLARRYLELHDEIADLQVPMHALVSRVISDFTLGFGIMEHVDSSCAVGPA